MPHITLRIIREERRARRSRRSCSTSSTKTTTATKAFAENRDPPTGHDSEPDYRALFTRIVTIVPAPIGLGPPPL